MTTPYFSIVVPTHNRPRYVVAAVESLLRQTFSDLEVIVSDNSSPAEAELTRAALAPLLSDPRCRYVRPTNDLSMVAHWEWAVQHASGEYIGVLTDRMALRYHTLEIVAGLAEKNSPASICTEATTLLEMPGYVGLARPAGTIISRKIDSAHELYEFSRGIMRKDCPRMLNSWTKKSVMSNLRVRFGSLYSSISPDYFFCFRLLDAIDTYISIDTPLLVVQGEHLSNGRSLKVGKINEASSRFLEDIKRDQSEWLNLGPIKGDVWIIPNAILREYDAVAKTSVTGKMPPIDIQSFYENTLSYLKRLASSGNLSEMALNSMVEFQRETGVSPVEPLHSLAEELSRLPKKRFARPIREKLRTALEPTIARIGLGRRLVAPTISDVLSIDAHHFAKMRIKTD